MFPVVLRTTPRRFAAFVQLMLFVFSASTSLLPCGDMNAANSASHHGMTAVVAAGDANGHHHHGVAGSPASTSATLTAPSSTTSSSTTPSTPTTETTCPWVVGCVGMVQYTIDVAWRSVEHHVPSTAPSGDVLQRVITHREIDSPPPRI